MKPGVRTGLRRSSPLATPQGAAAMMGSVSVGANWSVSGNLLQAVVVGAITAGCAYPAQRWSLSRAERAKQ